MNSIIAGYFDDDGFPCLEVQVWNKKQHLFLPAKAIVDTGAAHCLVREDLASQLQLPELRTADYRHPVFGQLPVKEYVMDLRFDINSTTESSIIEGIRAGTLLDLAYPAEVIIGVEVLKHCALEYNGREKRFRLNINP